MRTLLLALLAAALLGCGDPDRTGTGGHPMVRPHAKGPSAAHATDANAAQAGQ